MHVHLHLHLHLHLQLEPPVDPVEALVAMRHNSHNRPASGRKTMRIVHGDPHQALLVYEP